MRLLKHAYWSLASWGTPPIEQFNYTTDSDGGASYSVWLAPTETNDGWEHPFKHSHPSPHLAKQPTNNHH